MLDDFNDDRNVLLGSLGCSFDQALGGTAAATLSRTVAIPGTIPDC